MAGRRREPEKNEYNLSHVRAAVLRHGYRLMIITRLRLKNWRNFRELDVRLAEVTYVIGPNASGKSNLHDVFRFLRDVCKPQGGGLQAAVAKRSGIRKLRCLHARKNPEIRIEVELSDPITNKNWEYLLEFKSMTKDRVAISREEVRCEGKIFLVRPNENDLIDRELLTQTHLEQIQANAEFREIVEFFSSITYLHLVPQLLKYSEMIGGRVIEDDPFGQGFLERISLSTNKTRTSRLNKIKKALKAAVPQFDNIQFSKDKAGRPHLEAFYSHFRPKAGWQSEEHMSDGTLRLIALFWSLLDGDGVLLLEEPELSLNEEIVRQLPRLIDHANKSRKTKRQILITTHSNALLSNSAIDFEGVIVLEPGLEGTTGRSVNKSETAALSAGLPISDVVLPKTNPSNVHQMELF